MYVCIYLLYKLRHCVRYTKYIKIVTEPEVYVFIYRSASRVSNRDRTLSGGSTPSIVGGSLTRVNSVTSVLKRLFSKEDRPDGGTSAGTKTPGRLATSSSAASLQNRAIGMSKFCILC